MKKFLNNNSYYITDSNSNYIPETKGNTTIYFYPNYEDRKYFTYVNKITISHAADHLLEIILEDILQNYDKYCTPNQGITSRDIKVFSPSEKVINMVENFFKTHDTEIRCYTQLFRNYC